MNYFWRCSIFLLGLFSLSEAQICYVVDNSPFKVLCSLNETKTTSVVWKATVNQTRVVTLANCTWDGCLTEFDYNDHLQATSEWDITNHRILESNLYFSSSRLHNATFFLRYKNITCEGSNIEEEVCEKIEAYDNPKDVNCDMFDVNMEYIIVACTVSTADPRLSFKLDIKYDNHTLNIMTNLSQSCEPSKNLNDSSLYAMSCSFHIPFSILGPGINELSIETSANTNDPDRLKIKSNVMRIPLKENLQNFSCSDVDSRMIMMCFIPRSYTEINSTITLKSNESAEYVKLYDDVDYLISSTDTPTLKFKFWFTPKELQGKQEFRITMSTVNSSGIMTELSTPWAEVDFYYPTWMNFTINGTSNEMAVNVGDTVEIVCSMNGYPEQHYKVEYHPYFFFTYDFGHRHIMTINSFEDTGYLLCEYDNLYLRMERRINLFVRSIICHNLIDAECPEQDYLEIDFVGNTLTIPVYGYPPPETMVLVNKSYSGDIFMTENVSVVYEAVRSFSGNIIVTLDSFPAKTTHFNLLINNGVGNGSILVFEMEGDLPWQDRASSSSDTKVRKLCIFLLALMWIIQCD